MLHFSKSDEETLVYILDDLRVSQEVKLQGLYKDT